MGSPLSCPIAGFNPNIPNVNVPGAGVPAAKPAAWQYFLASVITMLPDIARYTFITSVALSAIYGMLKVGMAVLPAYSATPIGMSIGLLGASMTVGVALFIFTEWFLSDPSDSL
jgi:uncharacterized membrane protein YdjX (TVP38/TMEM64 family)